MTRIIPYRLQNEASRLTDDTLTLAKPKGHSAKVIDVLAFMAILFNNISVSTSASECGGRRVDPSDRNLIFARYSSWGLLYGAIPYGATKVIVINPPF